MFNVDYIIRLANCDPQVEEEQFIFTQNTTGTSFHSKTSTVLVLEYGVLIIMPVMTTFLFIKLRNTRYCITTTTALILRSSAMTT